MQAIAPVDPAAGLRPQRPRLILSEERTFDTFRKSPEIMSPSDEAYHERASEVPGVLELIRDGKVAHTVSGWALGAPVGDMAWIEETGDEYRYRVARTGGRRESG